MICGAKKQLNNKEKCLWDSFSYAKYLLALIGKRSLIEATGAKPTVQRSFCTTRASLIVVPVYAWHQPKKKYKNMHLWWALGRSLWKTLTKYSLFCPSGLEGPYANYTIQKTNNLDSNNQAIKYVLKFPLDQGGIQFPAFFNEYRLTSSPNLYHLWQNYTSFCPKTHFRLFPLTQ